MVKTTRFIETSSSHNRLVVHYYARNINNIQSYILFLGSIKSDLFYISKISLKKNAIKFNLKLEATYKIPNVVNSFENRSFVVPAKAIFAVTDLNKIIDQAIIYFYINNFSRLIQYQYTHQYFRK